MITKIQKITSSQNPKVKHAIQLQRKAKVRKKTKQFIFEGIQELELALEGGYEILQIFVCKNIVSLDYVDKVCSNFENLCRNIVFFELEQELYQKIALRDSTEGVCCIAKQKIHDLEYFQKRSKTPLYLVAEGLEKPGNLGAIFRTADAVKVDAIFIADAKTELYNPNTIRSSVGTIFTIPIYQATSEQINTLFTKHEIQCYSACLQDAKPYYLYDYTQATAIVVGTESTGLTSKWRRDIHHKICIPMCGKVDSLNVSVATAILLAEAQRQKIIKT